LGKTTGGSLKLFRFRGGVHPDGQKEYTTDKAIQTPPLPKYLYVPLKQHVGAPSVVHVKVGQHVLKGESLAHAQGNVSSPIHAPSSGAIVAIDDFVAPHPSGLPVLTITIETDGKDEWCELPATKDPFTMTSDEIADTVAQAGIVGMGGAAFPAAVKLRASKKATINTLIINGAECEPYLTADDRSMQERSNEIVDGARIIMRALQARNAVIAIENNKRLATKAMIKACEDIPEIRVASLPARYPMGSAKQMIQTITGTEVPAGGHSADVGVMVHNVGTAYAVHRVFRNSEPLISRVVTVSGDAVKEPKNLEVLIGTPVSELFEYCGGFKQQPARLLMGGPMMGQALPNTEMPVVKGLSGVVALSADKARGKDFAPCIRCGTCVSICPMGLMPLEMASRARVDDFKAAEKFGLVDCIECGSCAYACPSNIPLVQYFSYARGQLESRKRAELKAIETRKLIDARNARLERIKREKAEALAKSKQRARKNENNQDRRSA
jgi:electron transport complex protein RnfC